MAGLTAYHHPVLLSSVLKCFEPSIQSYVDLTSGLGGHASFVSSRFRPTQITLLDTDQEMLWYAKQRVTQNLSLTQSLTVIHANYSQVAEVLPSRNADAILMDLGVASPHFDDPERGMSFLHDGDLDMRLNRQSSLTAKQIVNTYSESALARIVHDYGEEQHYRAVARQIVAAREEAPIQTTKQLVEILRPVLGTRKRGTNKIHPCTKTFQALRIETNNELGHLKLALNQLLWGNVLRASGGKLAVITFHSLEDKLVKDSFALAAHQGRGKLLYKKPLTPDFDEIKINPRARSAKLRVFELFPLCN